MHTALLDESSHYAWGEYVRSHPDGTLYHLPEWKGIIEKTYGHRTYYLMALGPNNQGSPDDVHSGAFEETLQEAPQGRSGQSGLARARIRGILPLVHIKHFLFGNNLVSLPYFDFAGVLTDSDQITTLLLQEAMEIGKRLRVDDLELRHISSGPHPEGLRTVAPVSMMTKSHKVRMLRHLPDSSEALMKSFKSKLRSQINKSVKDGLNAHIGGLELLDDFYGVLLVNMRDLGSPVHSKQLMKNVLAEFPRQSRVVVVYLDNKPLASSLIVGFGDTLENPWASALRDYSRLSPNMLLYWTMLQYATNEGYRFFDFGRSSPDEGTYRFKEQWGASPSPLYWQYVTVCGDGNKNGSGIDKAKYSRCIRYWKKIPVSVTRFIGPMIRKYVAL